MYVITILRQHDIRIALNAVDIIPHDGFTIVKKILRTIRYSKAEQALTFVPRSDGWGLTFIRHKIRTPYVIDDKHIVTCSCIEDYGVDWMKHHQDEPFTLMLKDFNKRHYEMEVNLRIMLINSRVYMDNVYLYAARSDVYFLAS